MGVLLDHSTLRELIPSSGSGELEEPALLSASDLISLLDNVRARSEEIREKVRRHVTTNNAEFVRVITHASQTVANVENVSNQVKNFVELLGQHGGPKSSKDIKGNSPHSQSGTRNFGPEDGHRNDDEIGDAKLVDVEICRLAAEVKGLRSRIKEREEALVVVETISTLHNLLLATEKKFVPSDLIEAAKGMVILQRKLGLQNGSDDRIPREHGDVRAFKLLQDAWSERHTKLLGLLEDLHSKAIVLDERRSELVVTPHIAHEMGEVGAESGSVELSSVFTAMDVLGVLDIRLAKLGDAVVKRILSPLLMHSQTIISTLVLASGAGPKRSVLKWNFGTQQAEAVPDVLYPKIIQVIKFLNNHVFGNLDGRMGRFGRVVWPRLAEAVIAGCLSKAVPSETSQLKDFESIAALTANFEKDLASEGLIANYDPARGDKLSTFASDVEVHFALKKKKHVLSKARALLMQTDYNLSKSTWKTISDENLETDRSMHLFPDPCAISVLTKSLLRLVHESVEDACLSTPRTALELYRASRDALLLFRAMIPLKVAAQPKVLEVSALCHNDCLYIAHEILTFVFQYHKELPPYLKQVFTFVDLVPIFRQMAIQVLYQQIELVQSEIMEVLNHANGFQSMDDQIQFQLAEQALEEVFNLFSTLRSHLRPVLAHSVYKKVMGGVINLVIKRIMYEVFSISDMGVEETAELQKLLYIVQKGLPPFLAPLVVDVSEKDLVEVDAVEKSVPLWPKLEFLTNLLDMKLVAINQAWENGDLPSCGFSPSEVQRLVRAIFSETPLREQCLRRIGSSR